MPTQTVIDDEFVTLVYHHEAGIVHHTFHRFVSGDHFRNTLQQGCELLRQNHGTKWLSDDRGNSALTPSDSLWGDTVWAPAVMAAGWKYWAIILPDQHVAQIQVAFLREPVAKATAAVIPGEVHAVAQGAGLGIPSQFMSALPYLATVIVLVLISRARTGGSTAPAALGTVFVPDR